MDYPPDIAAAPTAVREHYARMVNAGQTPRFAEMAALQSPPGTKGTDRALMQGRYNMEYMGQMHSNMAKRLVREAKAAGISTDGKFYMGGLADKRAHRDPKAWIDSVSDIKRVAQERDLHVQGIIDYTPPEKPPKRSVDIDPAILRENVMREIKSDPSLKKSEAVERVKEKIVPHWKRKQK